MAELKDKVTRKNLPKGRDGEYLVIDSRMPRGLRWRKGIDRLITDMAPVLAGDLDANDNSITGIDNLTFTDGQGEVAGIDNENLLDKTATGSVAGLTALTFTGVTGTVAGIQNQNLIDRTDAGSIADVTALTFDDVTHPIAGIQNQNLVDKEAAETINGAWTHGAAIAMGTNKITGVGDPTAAQDAATKAYVDTQHAGYLRASHTIPSGTIATTAAGQTPNDTPHLSGWTLHANSGWSESSAELKYDDVSGSDTRLFLVNWSVAMHYYSTNRNLALYGKIEKKADGAGSFSDVAGSLELSSTGHYGILFGYYFYHHNVSGSCIVSMQEDDVIKFRYGSYNISAVTYSAIASGGLPSTPGATLTITPIS